VDLGNIDVGDTIARAGSTSGKRDDGRPTCTNEVHRDEVYRVLVLAEGTLEATLDPAGWKAALQIFSGVACDASVAGVCDQNSDPVTIGQDVTEGQTYFIWIDGANQGPPNQAGAYALTLKLVASGRAPR
jgi:hypothetical protein